MSTTSARMTTEELLALPEDGVERELIHGELRERAMTRRNRRHAATEAKISQLLSNWSDSKSENNYGVLSGEAGVILSHDPDTTVGIDVAVFSLDVLENQPSESSMVDGVPVLAVEILSPSDQQETIHEKVVEYLRAGVSLIWEIDPEFKTVRVHRPGMEPTMVNQTQPLTGEDVLPGFEVSVAELFPSWN